MCGILQKYKSVNLPFVFEKRARRVGSRFGAKVLRISKMCGLFKTEIQMIS